MEKTDDVAGYQIISLGAGFDTRLFRFVDEFKGKKNGKLDNLRYFEIDFEQVIDEKRRIVERTPSLKELSSSWRPISFDLNGNIEKLELGPDFDPEAPTLVVAECCLMYLTAFAGDNLIAWAGNFLKSNSVTFCSFDPILADDLKADRFAKTMLDNFETRGLDTRALLAYPSKSSVIRRFTATNNFLTVDAYTLLQLERDNLTEFLVSGQDRRHMAIKAALDEFEEWNLLANHYLLIIARK